MNQLVDSSGRLFRAIRIQLDSVPACARFSRNSQERAPVPDAGIEGELNANMKLAGQLGATGTPLFVVGNRVMNGAVGYDMLKDAIAKARAKA